MKKQNKEQDYFIEWADNGLCVRGKNWKDAIKNNIKKFGDMKIVWLVRMRENGGMWKYLSGEEFVKILRGINNEKTR